MPLFGKTRRSGQQKETTPQPLFEEVTSQEFSLKLSYSAKSSEGVRLKAGPALVARLASMLDGYVKGLSELVEPVPPEMVSATPFIARMPGSAQWLQYHHKRSPVTRHALVVLESVDAVDMAFETLACGLLDGETDTLGYPDYNAIVGGVASHWDEITGDMIVRAVVATLRICWPAFSTTSVPIRTPSGRYLPSVRSRQPVQAELCAPTAGSTPATSASSTV